MTDELTEALIATKPATVRVDANTDAHRKNLERVHVSAWLREWAVWVFENTDNVDLWQRAKNLSLRPPFDENGKRVYFIQEDGSEHFKIGVTSDLNARICSMQTSNPRGLFGLVTVAGGEKLEAALHGALSHIRVNGEWFRTAPELLSLIELLIWQTKQENHLNRATYVERDAYLDLDEGPVPTEGMI